MAEEPGGVGDNRKGECKMKHPLEKKRTSINANCAAFIQEAKKVQSEVDQIGKEYGRVVNISSAPAVIIDDIDKQFSAAVRLNKKDITFLFIATALQLARQYLLTPLTERLNDQDAADAAKDGEKEHSNRHHRWYNPPLEEIITNPVPFDANIGANGALKDFGFLGHRGATPGHDPLLGFVFGTANIATSTLTTWKMNSYHIKTGLVNGRGGPRAVDVFSNRASTATLLNKTFNEKLFNNGMDGKIIVGTSVLKEMQHLKSDVYSKNSLPLPAISAIDPKFAGELAKRGLDMAKVLDVGKQFAMARSIDVLIAIIHGMLCTEDEKQTPGLYEVRTRRILVWSNLIASTSNAAFCGIATYAGADMERFFDWGGYLNTIHRVAFDAKKILEIKKDFLKNALYDRITGDEYDFMKEENH